jgi:hypothetical protein
MYYVVVIETEDENSPDYKVFSQSGDAVKRYNIAIAAQALGNPVRVAGELANVISCGLFKANAPNGRDAIQLVKKDAPSNSSRLAFSILTTSRSLAQEHEVQLSVDTFIYPRVEGLKGWQSFLSLSWLQSCASRF